MRHSNRSVLRVEKLISQESIWNVSFTLRCARNYCQHFLHEKTLFRAKFWGLSFENRRANGLDIPRRLNVKANMKQQKFIMI